MTILKNIIKINSKLQDSRFINEMPAEEMLCMLRKELAELSAETNLSDLEALMLAGIAMATISKEKLFQNYQLDMHGIAGRINMTNFEILRHHKIFDTLAEKSFITISDYDFDIIPEKVTGKRFHTISERIKSSIPQFNKRYELSEGFVQKMLED